MFMKKNSETFKPSIKKIYLWQKKKRRNRQHQTCIWYQTGHRSKIKDINSFSKFIEDNQDITVDKIIENLVRCAKIQRTII